MKNYIKPNWIVPLNIHAYTTTRESGNFATYVGNEIENVLKNRAILRQELQLPTEPFWLKQEHTARVVQVNDYMQQLDPVADASYTLTKNVVCAVLTADCLPILLCDKSGSMVAAIHAGWKGLADGIIKATLQALPVEKENIIAWLGPAIGSMAFEVGVDVRDKFITLYDEARLAFKQITVDKWLADIYLLAKQHLIALGVNAIYGGDFCTFTDSSRFFSFRREHEKAGRMATVIWIG